MPQNIYEVVYTKYNGETKIFLARNSEEAFSKAIAWGKKNRFGTDIDELKLYGSVDG